MLNTIVYLNMYFILLYEYNSDRLALYALKLQKLANINEALGQVVTFCAVVYFLSADLGMLSVPLGFILGIFITRTLVLFYWKNNSEILLKLNITRAQFNYFWCRLSGSMGRSYLLYGLILLLLQTDMMLLGWLGGGSVAAEYYILWKIPEAIVLLIGRIPATYAPYLINLDARQKNSDLEALYIKVLWLIVLISFLAGVAYATFGEMIVRAWVGNVAPSKNIYYVLAGIALFCSAVIQWPSVVSYALVYMNPLLGVTLMYIFLKFSIIILSYDFTAYIAPLIGIVVSHLLGIFVIYLWVGRNAIKVRDNSC